MSYYVCLSFNKCYIKMNKVSIEKYKRFFKTQESLNNEEVIIVNTGDRVKVVFNENDTNNVLEFCGTIFIGLIDVEESSIINFGGLLSLNRLNASIMKVFVFNNDSYRPLISIDSALFFDRGYNNEDNFRNIPLHKKNEMYVIYEDGFLNMHLNLRGRVFVFELNEKTLLTEKKKYKRKKKISFSCYRGMFSMFHTESINDDSYIIINE